MPAHYFNSQPREGGWDIRGSGTVEQDAFQLTAARRRLAATGNARDWTTEFQLTAARRRLAPRPKRYQTDKKFQLTAARRRLDCRCP